MARIFLSYAREDLDAARAFADALERGGHTVWWDHQLRAGSRFSWDIDVALKGAEAVVVLWSKSSIESAWVQDEAAEGLEPPRLVPVALDGSKPPLGFRQYHTIDLSAWNSGGASFEPVLEAIDALISGTAISSPPPPREARCPPPLICVLPFTNKSGVPDQDYFSEGISADVITDLCKISALAVIDSNTSFALKGQPLDLKQLGRDFAATHVLDGAVRRSGTRLRISAQLIEIASGRSLWAERYDRELSDVFEIQDEISHAIVAALQLTLLPKEKQALDQRGTSNAEAYDTYLRARALWSSGTIGDYRSNEEIVRMCTEATALDPSYASAWALRALASAELRFWQGLAVDALASAERAIELDDRLPEPHCVRARKLEELGRVAEAEAAAHDAINLDQQSWEANREIAQLMFRRGQVRDALVYFEQAVALMRTDHDSASMLVSCYASVGDDSGSRNAALAAVARSEHRIICDPLNGSAFASGACGLAALGNHERAQKWIRKALAVDPGNLSMRYSLAATIAVHFHDEAQALDILGPFAECIRFLPHLRLLELDPRWAWMRERAPFQAIMERARKRLGSMSSSELMC